MDSESLHNPKAASLLRRLIAALYDWLLVIALMMVLSTPVVALLDQPVTPANNYYRAGLVLIAIAFFAGFWSYGGQTLGMKAWRLKLSRRNGARVSIGRAALRFFCAGVAIAPAGLGFLWILWDRNGLAWHDHWCDTHVTLVAKPRPKHSQN